MRRPQLLQEVNNEPDQVKVPETVVMGILPGTYKSYGFGEWNITIGNKSVRQSLFFYCRDRLKLITADVFPGTGIRLRGN